MRDNTLQLLQQTMRHESWRIGAAVDGALGLEMRTEFVMRDAHLPGMSDAEFLTHVSARAPRAQFISRTCNTSTSTEEAYTLRFLNTPWNHTEHSMTARRAFADHRWHTGLKLHVMRRAMCFTHAPVKACHSCTWRRTMTSKLAECVTHTSEKYMRQHSNMSFQVKSDWLLQVKHHWSLFFDLVEMPLTVVEQGFLLRHVNRAAEALGGHAINNLEQTLKCHKFLFGRDDRCGGCPLGDELTEPRTAELQHANRTFLAQAFPIPDAAVTLCMYREVTAERELAKQLIANDKMAAISSFAGGTAHEVNNSLGSILAFSQIMQRSSDRSDREAEMLGLIEKSAIRCKQIVESLLRFSRYNNTIERRVFNLSQCIEEVLLLFRAEAHKYPKVQVDSNLAAGLQVYGDVGQLSQVLFSLLENALESLPEHVGKLTVTTGIAGGLSFFSVKDTGCGISKAHLSCIFEPHFTTKSPNKGTGLGLSAAQRIVEDHRGRMTVESAQGRGSTFTVVVPQYPNNTEDGAS